MPGLRERGRERRDEEAERQPPGDTMQPGNEEAHPACSHQGLRAEIDFALVLGKRRRDELAEELALLEVQHGNPQKDAPEKLA